MQKKIATLAGAVIMCFGTAEAGAATHETRWTEATPPIAQLGSADHTGGSVATRSRRAFAGLGREQVRSLLAHYFPDTTAEPGRRPLAEFDVLAIESPFTARVRREGSHGGNMVTTLAPLAAPDGKGGLRPLDLRLEPSPRGYRARHSGSSADIPRRIEGGVILGSGIRVRPSGSAPALLPEPDGAAVIYPNSARDTDSVVRTIAGGVELFETIRSEDAPEEFSIAIEGAGDLALVADGDETAVERNGRRVATIGEAVARDAAGRPVPVETELSGTTLTMRMPHRGRGAVYPIELDPTVWDRFDYQASTNYGEFWTFDGRAGWQYETGGNPAPQQWIGDTWPGDGHHAEFRGSGWFAKGTRANLKYRPPGNTLITQTLVDHASVAARGMDVCLVSGLRGEWNGVSQWQSHMRLCDDGRPDVCCGDEQFPPEFSYNRVVGHTNDRVISGVEFETDGYRSLWHVLTRDVLVVLLDDVKPTVTTDAPSGWSQTDTAAATARDADMGVREVTFQQTTTPTGGSTCAGRAAGTCPVARTTPRVTFGEGITPMVASALDGVKNASAPLAAPAPTSMKVDKSAPALGSATAFPGQVTNQSKTVTVTARDGDPWGTAADARSGVQSMEVFLTGPDGVRKKVGEKTNATGQCTLTQGGVTRTFDHSCPMTMDYTFVVDDENPAGTGPRPGAYVAEFVAKDRVGLDSKTVWSFVKVDVLAPRITRLEHGKPLPPHWVHRHFSDVFADAWDPGFSGLHQLDFTEPLLAGRAQQSPYRYLSILNPTKQCEANALDPCPISSYDRLTGKKEGVRTYDSDHWREGIVSAALRVRDAAGNTSDPASEFVLKVDRTAPTIDTPTGDLWTRRNRDDDHRFEGLYEQQHTVSVMAHDGTEAGRRSGVKQVKYELVNAAGSVVNTQTKAGSCDTNNGCHWDLPADFTLRSDDFPDGDYTVKITATDQLNHAADTAWPVTIDRRGDVHDAQLHTSNPATGGGLIATESHQLGTTQARRSVGAETTTRRAIPCPADPAAQCAELRELTSPEGEPGPDLSIVRSRNVAEPRLSRAAEMPEYAAAATGTPVESGQLVASLEPWQRRPPAAGDTYQLYEYEEPAVTDTGTPTPERVRVWIDALTRLPVRAEVSVDGVVTEATRFTYERSRRTATEVPADWFAVPAPPGGVSREADLPASPEDAAAPPPTRDQRIASGQRFRRTFGLPDDHALVAAAVDSGGTQTSRSRYGVPLLAAEETGMEQRLAVADAITHVDDYINAHADAAAAYGGAYIAYTSVGAHVHVNFTRDAVRHEVALKNLFPFPASISTHTVARTLAEVDALTERLRTDWDTLVADGIPVTSLASRVRGNVVDVASSAPSEAQEQLLATRYGGGARLVQGGEAEEDHGHLTRRTFPGPPWRGGIRIVNAETNGRCTLGFAARRGALYRFLTSAHCGPKFSLWEHTTPAGSRIVGTMTGSTFPANARGQIRRDADAATIQVTRAQTRYRVINRTRGDSWEPQAINRVARLRDGQVRDRSHEGTFLCQSGQTAEERRCGHLTSRSVDKIARPDFCDCSVKLMRQMEANYERAGGDSGAPVYSGTTAWGIHQGSHESGLFGLGGEEPVFTPLENVSAALDGLQVVTGL